MMERLLVALDGSPHSDKALDIAADLAETYGAELMLVHVMSSAPLNLAERELAAAEYADELASWATDRERTGSPTAEGSGRNLLLHYRDLTHHFRETMGNHVIALANRKLSGRHINPPHAMLVDGDPAETIIKLAKEKMADAVVIGSRGMSDLKGLFLGSVSHKVNHLAPCTCITVK